MVKLTGLLINLIPQSEYKNDQGLPTPTKAKVQILVESFRANGTKIKELHTISIPDSKIGLYKDKLNKDVEVDVGIMSKEKYSFYGI